MFLRIPTFKLIADEYQIDYVIKCCISLENEDDIIMITNQLISTQYHRKMSYIAYQDHIISHRIKGHVVLCFEIVDWLFLQTQERLC